MGLHDEITDRILKKLREGTAPWVKPWTVPLPYNGATQHRYSGINVLLLWDAPYRRPAWVTFRQAAALSARVKRGEHATPIVYVSTIQKIEDEEEKNIPFLRRYHVFNVKQVDGLPSNLYAPPATGSITEIERFFAGVGADVRHGGVAAYFDRKDDHIQLPDPEHFVSREQYYATRLHESVHWTGHAGRLNRQFGKRFGDDAYVFEELVAELGSAFLSAEFGLSPELHHANYLGNWIKLLSDHHQAVIAAAAHASKAANYLRSPATREPVQA